VDLEVLVIRLPIGMYCPQKINFSTPKASAVRNKLPMFGALVMLSQTRIIGNCFDENEVL